MMSDGLHTSSDVPKVWYLNDQLHREDGPAIERANGDKMWFLDGRLHRTDGPAVEWADGSKEWFLNGQELSLNRWLEANAELSGQQRVMFKLEWA
jgi:hypothetical protein